MVIEKEANVLNTKERVEELERVRSYMAMDMVGNDWYALRNVAKRIAGHVGLDADSARYRILDVVDADPYFEKRIGKESGLEIRHTDNPKPKMAPTHAQFTEQKDLN